MIICLTGKGNDPSGKLITRPEWERMIAANGHVVTDNAANCTVLVASRDDTVKAANARARGARVESYEWLWRLLQTGDDSSRGLSALSRPAPKPIDTSAMEDNELWGQF